MRVSDNMHAHRITSAISSPYSPCYTSTSTAHITYSLLTLQIPCVHTYLNRVHQDTKPPIAYMAKHVYSTLAKKQKKKPRNLTPTNPTIHTRHATYIYTLEQDTLRTGAVCTVASSEVCGLIVWPRSKLDAYKRGSRQQGYTHVTDVSRHQMLYYSNEKGHIHIFLHHNEAQSSPLCHIYIY